MKSCPKGPPGAEKRPTSQAGTLETRNFAILCLQRVSGANFCRLEKSFKAVSVGGYIEEEPFEDLIFETLFQEFTDEHVPDELSLMSESNIRHCIGLLFSSIDHSQRDAISWDEFLGYGIDATLKGPRSADNKAVKRYRPQGPPRVGSDFILDGVRKITHLPSLKQLLVVGKQVHLMQNFDSPPVVTFPTAKLEKVLDAEFLESLDAVAISTANSKLIIQDKAKPSLQVDCQNNQVCLRWHDRGRILYSGDNRGSFHQWSFQGSHVKGPSRLTPTEGAGFKIHEASLTDMLVGDCFSTDGAIVTASMDTTVALVDSCRQQVVTRYAGHTAAVLSIAYSPEYSMLFSGGFDTEALAWSSVVPNCKAFVLRDSSANLGAIIGIQCVPSSPQVITTNANGQVRVWDIRTLRPIQWIDCSVYVEVGDGANAQSKAMAYIPGESTIAVATRRSVLLFTNEGGAEVSCFDDRVVEHMAFNARDNTILTSSGRDLKVWDASTGSVRDEFINIVPSDIVAMCVAQSWRRFYLADLSGVISSFNSSNGTRVASFVIGKKVEEMGHFLGATSVIYAVTTGEGISLIYDDQEITHTVCARTVEGGEYIHYYEQMAWFLSVSGGSQITIWNASKNRVLNPKVEGSIEVETRPRPQSAHAKGQGIIPIVSKVAIACFAVLDDCHCVIIATTMEELQLWCLPTENLPFRLLARWYPQEFSCVGFTVIAYYSPSCCIYVGTEQGNILCYELTSVLETVYFPMPKYAPEQYLLNMESPNDSPAPSPKVGPSLSPQLPPEIESEGELANESPSGPTSPATPSSSSWQAGDPSTLEGTQESTLPLPNLSPLKPTEEAPDTKVRNGSDFLEFYSNITHPPTNNRPYHKGPRRRPHYYNPALPNLEKPLLHIPCKAHWKAHKDSISSMLFFQYEGEDRLLTSSFDEAVHAWTLFGTRLGTLDHFGRAKWDLSLAKPHDGFTAQEIPAISVQRPLTPHAHLHAHAQPNGKKKDTKQERNSTKALPCTDMLQAPQQPKVDDELTKQERSQMSQGPGNPLQSNARITEHIPVYLPHLFSCMMWLGYRFPATTQLQSLISSIDLTANVPKPNMVDEFMKLLSPRSNPTTPRSLKSINSPKSPQSPQSPKSIRSLKSSKSPTSPLSPRSFKSKSPTNPRSKLSFNLSKMGTSTATQEKDFFLTGLEDFDEDKSVSSSVTNHSEKDHEIVFEPLIQKTPQKKVPLSQSGFLPNGSMFHAGHMSPLQRKLSHALIQSEPPKKLGSPSPGKKKGTRGDRKSMMALPTSPQTSPSKKMSRAHLRSASAPVLDGWAPLPSLTDLSPYKVRNLNLKAMMSETNGAKNDIANRDAMTSDAFRQFRQNVNLSVPTIPLSNKTRKVDTPMDSLARTRSSLTAANADSRGRAQSSLCSTPMGIGGRGTNGSPSLPVLRPSPSHHRSSQAHFGSPSSSSSRCRSSQGHFGSLFRDPPKVGSNDEDYSSFVRPIGRN